MRKSSHSLRWASSAAALALAVLATSAQAQSVPSGADDGEADSASEIVVTAQKRTERLIDVPVSVNAVGAEQVDRQRIYSLGDLSRSVPSVSSNGAVRGISTGGAARSSSSAVAVLLDGVDLGPPAIGRSQIANLFDIERIEVLSGPQGTLFGTTASAGVISVVTRAPNPDKFEVIGKVEFAEGGFQREQLTVNLPLASTAAIRISGHNDEAEGVVRNTILNERPKSYTRGVRGRLLWEPSSALKVNLIADYDRSGGNGLGNVAYAIAPTPALQARLATCGITASLNNKENCAKGVSPVTNRDVKYGFSGQVDLALGDHTLTSITAWRRHEIGDLNYNGLGGDSDFLSENILDTNLTAEDLKTFSQEIRLTSPNGQPLEYVLGGYYFKRSQKDSVIQAGLLGLPSFLLPLLGIPPLNAVGRVTFLDIDQRAYAAFGQATYHVTDQFSLIAGARYTDDKVTDVSTSLTPLTTPTLASYGYAYSPSFFLAPVNATKSIHNFSWKLGAQYQFNPNAMAYFSATRGYKGPAVNDQASPPIAIPIIEPEIPMAYELGFKGAFLDNRLLATLALYTNKVKNFQTSVYVPPSASSPQGSFAQGNAPYIRVRGIDFNVTARPTDDLTLTGGLLYNRATYADTFVVACAASQATGVGGCSATRTTKPVSQIAGVPRLRLLLNGEYAPRMSENVTGFLQADISYESSIFAGTTPDPITDISGKTLVNIRLGLRDPDRKWGVSIFARNLLGTNYSLLSGDPLSGFNGGAGLSYWINPQRGMTVGGSVDFHF